MLIFYLLSAEDSILWIKIDELKSTNFGVLRNKPLLFFSYARQMLFVRRSL